jgi:ADP-ribosylglycohydrolase
MLLEMSIGDAYGCCFEWTDRWIIRNKNKLKYITLEENPSLIKPGNYTDDTQMSLAIAELMLEYTEWDDSIIAKKFVECFHRDPRRGYAPGFYLFLRNHHDSESFLRDIRPSSERSGAAMRAAPLGLIKDLEELTDKCNAQAAVTHKTLKGMNSALCVAQAAHYCFYNLGKKDELLDWLRQWHSIDLDSLKEYTHIPVEGWPCVLAALHAVANNNKFSDVLTACVNFAGDTDTIATIACGIASVCNEIEKDIPQELIDGLENGSYGRDYILNLDKQLMDKYGNI